MGSIQTVTVPAAKTTEQRAADMQAYWPVPCQNSHNASELVISELVRPLSDTR